jgi:Fic family protein
MLSIMLWIWHLKEWPTFRRQNEVLHKEERRFSEGVSVYVGTLRHVALSKRESLAIAMPKRDASGSSAIEGELQDRDSVQSSLHKNLGLSDKRPQLSPGKPREYMLADLYSVARCYVSQYAPVS